MELFLYNDLNSFLRSRFGCRVQKITIDAGLTCPNRDGTVGLGGCIYCNDRGSGTGAFKYASITEQILSAKEFLRRRYKAKKFIAYFQSFSNTYAPVEKLRSLYEEALGVEDIAGLAVGTRPDCAGGDVLDLLAEMNERTYVNVEYGLQSIHERTLKFVNRHHTYHDFVKAVNMTVDRGIKAGVHVIIGLPGETKEDILKTADKISRLAVSGIKFHALHVIKDTKLAEYYGTGDIKLLSLDGYVEILCDFLERLSPECVIFRIVSDAKASSLVAPDWINNKALVLSGVEKELKRRSSRQGKKYKVRKQR